jgi:hypothetical protein
LFLTSFITLLTTSALYLSPENVVSPVKQSNTNDPVVSDFIYEPTGNTNAFTEQIDALTRQLLAEKYRTTQLILLNELSQQLEAELDPPVSAQLAVNTLERAIDCSLVALFMHEPDNHEYVVLASAGRMTNAIPPGYRQDSGVGLLGRTTRSRRHISSAIPGWTLTTFDSAILYRCQCPDLQHGHIRHSGDSLKDLCLQQSRCQHCGMASSCSVPGALGLQQHILN